MYFMFVGLIPEKIEKRRSTRGIRREVPVVDTLTQTPVRYVKTRENKNRPLQDEST